MKQMKNFLVLISFTVCAVFSFSGAAQAAVTCRSLFADNRYGQLREDFVLDTSYKVEVPEQSEIKNQCNLGTCHLYSWISQLEHDAKVKSNSAIKISPHYLSVMHWVRQSLELLDKNKLRTKTDKNEVSVMLGANVLASRYSIYQSGIIPDEAWTGARDFHVGALSGRISEYIQNVIAKAKWEMSMQTTEAKQDEVREKAQMKIIEIFENVVGKIPRNFMYEGKMYTPQSFQRTFYPELLKPMTLMFLDDEQNAKTALAQDGPYFKVMLSGMDAIEKTMRSLLDKGQNVYLGYDHNSDFVDVKTGTMSISAFHVPAGAEPLTREQRAYFKIAPGGHAVQVVGYDLDPKTNQVTKWKIKNSWGEKMGDSGYFHMHQDFFRAFVMGISFYSDAGVAPAVQEVLPEQLELGF